MPRFFRLKAEIERNATQAFAAGPASQAAANRLGRLAYESEEASMMIIEKFPAALILNVKFIPEAPVQESYLAKMAVEEQGDYSSIAHVIADRMLMAPSLALFERHQEIQALESRYGQSLLWSLSRVAQVAASISTTRPRLLYFQDSYMVNGELGFLRAFFDDALMVPQRLRDMRMNNLGSEIIDFAISSIGNPEREGFGERTWREVIDKILKYDIGFLRPIEGVFLIGAHQSEMQRRSPFNSEELIPSINPFQIGLVDVRISLLRDHIGEVSQETRQLLNALRG